MECNTYTPPSNADLLVSQCGHEACIPGHQFGPAVRRCYLIHYVSRGYGEFIAQGRRHFVGPGQGFVIFPGDVTTYCASDEDPWHYRWIGYDGRIAPLLTQRVGLSRECPVFDLPEIGEAEAILDAVYRDISTLRLGDVSAVGGLLRFLSRIGQGVDVPGEMPVQSQMHAYFDKAAWYIEANLSRTIRVSDVAAFVGLCRSQLFRVFQAVAQCAPQEWIAKTRLARAEAMLLDRTLTLQEVALSVGYADTAQMGAAMKKRHHTSPSEYRKQYFP